MIDFDKSNAMGANVAPVIYRVEYCKTASPRRDARLSRRIALILLYLTFIAAITTVYLTNMCLISATSALTALIPLSLSAILLLFRVFAASRVLAK